jgi:DNA-binding transcriptional LysR family regulator
MVREHSSQTRPSLAALEVFVAVARLGSFRSAAAERGVSPSALSHVIRGLEDRLGIRLFQRTNRSIRLTEAGAHLLERVRPALGEVASALAGATAFAGRASGPLRINIPRIANELIIEPMVGRFLAAYPEIRLEVVTDDGLTDIVRDGFDAGIRRDRRLSPGMISLPVGPAHRFAVVGAPSYFEKRGRPLTPQDLHAHACIERRFPSGAAYAWEFSHNGEAFEVDVSGPLIVDDTALMLRAARDGVGLAVVIEDLVAKPLASGELQRVLEDWCPPQPRFHIYYPGRRLTPAPLRAFIDMLRETYGA